MIAEVKPIAGAEASYPQHKLLQARLRDNVPYARYMSEPKYAAVVKFLSQLLYDREFTGDELIDMCELAIRKEAIRVGQEELDKNATR